MDDGTWGLVTRRALVRRSLFGALALGIAASSATTASAKDATPVAGEASSNPLPSWEAGPVKQAILDFVAESVSESRDGFVPVEQRIATFDNDGTLWCEYPAPAQAYFALQHARTMAATEPDAARNPLFREVLSGALDDVGNIDPANYYALFDQINRGMSQERYIAISRAWLDVAIHPDLGKRFVDLVYQPQLELLAFLKANEFTSFVVSGGKIDFMRAFAPVVYGLPPWRMIGTNYAYAFDDVSGDAEIIETTSLNEVVVEVNKATSIALQVGLRPVLAIGNSDGDLEMLQFAKGGLNPALALLVHHTDAVREYAYDRKYAWSPFSKALDLADKAGFMLIDMKRDWRTIWRESAGPSLLAAPLADGASIP